MQALSFPPEHDIATQQSTRGGPPRRHLGALGHHEPLRAEHGIMQHGIRLPSLLHSLAPSLFIAEMEHRTAAI
jgi:hypothetical protein